MLHVEWRNPLDSLDINSDSYVSPLDALLIINELNLNTLGLDPTGALPDSRESRQPFHDASGDGFLTPIDALNVINALNEDVTGTRRLVEGELFNDEQVVTITLGQSKGSRHYRMRVESSLVAGDSPGLVPDSFHVYLVDPLSPSQTLLDQGEQGTSIFSLTSTAAAVAVGIATWDGEVLDVDLTSLKGRETGLLKLQLLRGDSSLGSQVEVSPLSNTVDPEGVPSIAFPASSVTAATSGPAQELSGLLESSSLLPIVTNVRYDDIRGRFTADVQIRNTGDELGRTVIMKLPGLPAGVTALGASGTDAQGIPYFNFRETIARGGLGKNEATRVMRLSIQNSDRIPFSLHPVVLVGGPNRAPVMSPIAALQVFPGANLDLPLEATDADGDAVQFAIRGMTSLPSGTLQPEGRLQFSPAPDDVGTYTFDIVASDGRLEAVQRVTLAVVNDPAQTTRISGSVLDVDGTPLPDIRIEVGGVRGLTDGDGRFLLDLGAGPLAADTIKIRGELLTGPFAYPFIAEKLPLLLGHDIFEHVNNQIERPIYLPKLDLAAGTQINPSQDTIAQNEDLPGISVAVKAGSLLNQQGSQFTGVLSITEVPPELTPAALPSNLLPDHVVTVQPGEMVFATPAPMTFPNRSGWAPGTLMDLWSINPVTGEFDDVGDMRVSADGTVIETISGGVRNSSWQFGAPRAPQPTPPQQDSRDKEDHCEECEAAASGNSEVLLHSGALMETHDLVSYQSLGQTRGLTLTYDSLRADPRPIVHFGYDNLAGGGGVVYATMEIQRGDFKFDVPGYKSPINQFRPFGDVGASLNTHFWSEISGKLDAALQVDMREQPSGRYDYNLDLGLGRLRGPCDLCDWRYELTGSSSTTTGKLITVNTMASPFGAGWGLNGLQQIVENPDGSLLFMDGDGGEKIFEPLADGYASPPGDFSIMEKLPTGVFRQTFPDRTIVEFNANGNLERLTDRNGNATQYVYDAAGLLQRIIDPVGLETNFNYESGRLAKITDPAGRVTKMQYDTAGNLTRVTDPDGSFRTFLYDSAHHMVGEIDQRGATEQAVYGFHGRVESVTRKDGSRSAFDVVQVQGLLPPEATTKPLSPPTPRDLGPAISRYSDASGNTIAKALDKRGQEVGAFDGLGPLPTVERDENNLVRKVTNSRGDVTEFEYDAQGNLTSVMVDIVRTGLVGGSLFSGEKFDVGNVPGSVVTGDFNGDGNSDLAVANIIADISILLGQGNGTFAEESRFAAGANPRTLIAGDYNEDGTIDLVVTNSASNDVSVLLGLGDGTFAVERRFSVGNGPAFVIDGDFNADGNYDLAVVNSGSDDISVLLGNGDSTFAPERRFSVGNFPLYLAAGDFNADGSSDLAIANNESDDVSVLLGKGDGTFAEERRFSVDSGPLSLITADFNEDGKSDLAITTSGAFGVSVMQGQGDGTFAAQLQFSVGEYPESLIAGDFNGDGDNDLAVVNYDSGDVSVLLGLGDGTFAAERRFAAGDGPVALTIGDFNEDGTTDLAVADSESDNLTMLLGQGDGTFGNERRFTEADFLESLIVGDFNDDGKGDLAVASFETNDVSVLLGNGDGTFGVERRFATGSGPISITEGDFNKDGRGDLAVANSLSNDISVLLGQGDGTFASDRRFAVGESPEFIISGDFNEDGNDDLAVANFVSNDVSVLLGQGDGRFAAEQRIAVGNGPISIAVGDFNEDGNVDLTVAIYESYVVSVLLGQGNGTFTLEQEFSVGDYPISVVAEDFNADGILDLAVANNDADNVSVLLGQGDGTFAIEERFSVGYSPESVKASDINGDGVSDLVVVNYGSNDVSVLLGLGDGTFAAQRRFLAGSGPESLIIEDLNGDGVNDLAVASAISNDVSVLLGLGGSGLQSTGPRVFSYNSVYNQIESTTDELGRTSLFTLDPASGNRLATTHVVGQRDSAANDETDDIVSTFTYTPRGLVDLVTDPLGRVTDYDYDALGRLTKITFAKGTIDEASHLFEYDPAGNRSAIIDANGNRTQFTYDAANRVTQVLEPDPDGAGPLAAPQTTFRYDRRGNLIEAIDAAGSRTANVYDSRDRVTSSRDAAGNDTHIEYDYNGNVLAVMDPNGNTTRFTYDARNRRTSSIDPDGGVTTFRYDSDNNLLFLIDPNGNRTRFAYDARSRLVREEDPLGKAIVYTYDAVDNLTQKVDRNGRKTQYEYDELNRLTTETWVDGGNVIRHSYDKASNLTSVADTFSSLRFTSDQRNRTQQVDNEGTSNAPHVVLNYSYDDVGNVLSVADTINGSAGATTGYSYDALNRTTRLTQAGAGVSDKRVDFAYNALGQYTSIERFADLVGTKSVVGTSYTYDTLNRLKALTHSGIAGPVAFYNYTYDAASRITRIEDIDGITDYTYDDRDQLVGADRAAGDIRGDESYTYDANGNRIHSHLHGNGYVTGPANRLLSDGSFNYEYDQEGNLIKRTEISTGSYREFTWDFRNRLIRVVDKTSAGAAVQDVSFTYDGMDRRISKAVDVTPEDAIDAVVMHFVYDREDVILDFLDSDGDGPTPSIIEMRYLHGPGIDQVLAQDDSVFIAWGLTDQLGTVGVLVDNFGKLTNHFNYDSFGNVLHVSDVDNLIRFTFTGREYDVETTLYYHRSRYRDSLTSVFLAEDPISFRGGDANLVRYVGNSPIVLSDAMGMQSSGNPFSEESLEKAKADFKRDVKKGREDINEIKRTVKKAASCLFDWSYDSITDGLDSITDFDGTLDEIDHGRDPYAPQPGWHIGPTGGVNEYSGQVDPATGGRSGKTLWGGLNVGFGF